MSFSIKHIENKALELFRCKGIKSVSMDDIAHEAGISKKTIYQNYLNKEELIVSVLKIMLQQITAEIDKIIQSDKNPIDKIVGIYNYKLRYINSFTSSFYWGIKKYYPKAENMCNDFSHDLVFNKIRKLLTTAKQQHIVREDIDVDMLCEIYFWGIEKFIYGDFSQQLNHNFDSFFNHFILNNLRGILSKEYQDILSISSSKVAS